MIMLLLAVGFGVILGIAFSRIRHGVRRRADETKYKERWEEALNLLEGEGRITPQQLRSLQPRSKVRLERGFGTSADRATIEIDRAERGLPPADNLEGMTSADRTRVELARLENGTAP